MVRLLLESGARLYTRSRYSRSALEVAALRGKSSLVRLILARAARFNAQHHGLEERCEYRNALLAAASQGHEEVVLLLLERGTDFNAQAIDYQTALKAACLPRTCIIGATLLRKGCCCGRPRFRVVEPNKCYEQSDWKATMKRTGSTNGDSSARRRNQYAATFG